MPILSNTMQPVPMPGLNQTALFGQQAPSITTDSTTNLGLGQCIRATPSGQLHTLSLVPRVQKLVVTHGANNYVAGKCIGDSATLSLFPSISTLSGFYTVESIVAIDQSTIKPDLDILFVTGITAAPTAITDNNYPNLADVNGTGAGALVTGMASIRSSNWVTFLSAAATTKANIATITPYICGFVNGSFTGAFYVIAPSGANYTGLANALSINVTFRITSLINEANTP